MSCQAANAKEKIHIGDNKEHTAFVHAVQKFGVSANFIYILLFLEIKIFTLDAFINQLG